MKKTISAVYAITHLPTGTVYVGATTAKKLNVVHTWYFGPQTERFAEHLGALRRGDHYNANLQAAWTGDHNDFDFQVLEYVPAGIDPFHVETQWMNAFPAIFNINKGLRNGRHTGERVTLKEQAQIVRLLKRGMKGKDIAAKLGFCTATISNVRRRASLPRATWKQKNEKPLCAYPLAKQYEIAIADPYVTKKTGEIVWTKTLAKHGIQYDGNARGWYRLKRQVEA